MRDSGRRFFGNSHWDSRKHKGYPDRQAFVWGKTASLETSSGVNIQATKKK